MSEPEPEPRQPAGWYPDPYAPQLMLRFWDGSAWTDQSTPRPKRADDTGLQVVGWFGAIAFPIVGLVIGIIVSSRGNTLAGLVMCGLSCASGFAYYDLFVSPAPQFFH